MESNGPFTLEETTNPVTYLDKYKLEICNVTELYPTEYADINYDWMTLLCPTFSTVKDAKLLNQHASANSTSYLFFLYKCNKEERKCADDLEEKFESIIVFFTIFEESINPGNYTHPYIKQERNLQLSFSNKLQKNMMVKFDYSEFESDNGWLFEDIKSQSLLRIDYEEISYSILEENSKEFKVAFTLLV